MLRSIHCSHEYSILSQSCNTLDRSRRIEMTRRHRYRGSCLACSLHSTCRQHGPNLACAATARLRPHSTFLPSHAPSSRRQVALYCFSSTLFQSIPHRLERLGHRDRPGAYYVFTVRETKATAGMLLDARGSDTLQVHLISA